MVDILNVKALADLSSLGISIGVMLWSELVHRILLVLLFVN